MSDENEYAFDLKLDVALRVKANSYAEAQQKIAAAFDCADCNFGSWPNGDPILGEASVNGQMDLFEVNNVSIDIPRHKRIGLGDRFAVTEDPLTGYRILRLDDGRQATFYGDDQSEQFRNAFLGDEFTDDYKENAEAADAVGAWAEEQGEL